MADVARPKLSGLQRTYQQVVPYRQRGQQDGCEHAMHSCGVQSGVLMLQGFNETSLLIGS